MPNKTTEAEYKISDCLNDFTLTVKLAYDWRARLGFAIMRFGAWIAGMGVERE